MKGKFESEAKLPLADKLPALLATLKTREEVREAAEARPKEVAGAMAEKSEAEKKQPASTVGYPRCYASAIEAMLDDAEFIDADAQQHVATSPRRARVPPREPAPYSPPFAVAHAASSLPPHSAQAAVREAAARSGPLPPPRLGP